MLRVSLDYSILNDIMPPVKPQPKRGYSSAKRRRCEQLLEARAAKEPALEPAVVARTCFDHVGIVDASDSHSDRSKFSSYYVISINLGASLLLPAV